MPLQRLFLGQVARLRRVCLLRTRSPVGPSVVCRETRSAILFSDHLAVRDGQEQTPMTPPNPSPTAAPTPHGSSPLFSRGSWAETKRITDVLRKETVGDALLVLGTVVALVWANFSWSGSYASLRDTVIGPHALHLNLSIGAVGRRRSTRRLLLHRRPGAQTCADEVGVHCRRSRAGRRLTPTVSTSGYLHSFDG